MQNQLIKASLTSLSKALESNKPSSVIIRESMKITPASILQKRRNYFDLLFEYRSTESSMELFKTNNKLKDNDRHVAEIEEKLKHLSNAISELEYPMLMLEERVAKEETLNKNLQLLMINLLRFFKVTDPMSADELEILATRIIWKFGGLSIDDVAACFNKAMNGDFGAVYNRVDGGVIMVWLGKYQEVQSKLIHEHNITVHSNAKGSTYKDVGTHRKALPKKLKELL